MKYFISVFMNYHSLLFLFTKMLKKRLKIRSNNQNKSLRRMILVRWIWGTLVLTSSLDIASPQWQLLQEVTQIPGAPAKASLPPLIVQKANIDRPNKLDVAQLPEIQWCDISKCVTLHELNIVGCYKKQTKKRSCLTEIIKVFLFNTNKFSIWYKI